jgi:serine/threonine protein kinase
MEYAAVKVIKQDLVEQTELQQIQLEAEILNHLSHKNIARFFEYDSEVQICYPNGDTATGVAIILEFCPGGDLFEFVVQTGSLTEPLARFFFKQLLEALVHMQCNGISHRDLK